MLDLLNFGASAVTFNLLFFLYASTKMQTKLNPLKTTVFAFLFNIPLSILLAAVYTIMMVYALVIGADEEAMWAYLEQRESVD
jgi:hypothetical protein